MEQLKLVSQDISVVFMGFVTTIDNDLNGALYLKVNNTFCKIQRTIDGGFYITYFKTLYDMASDQTDLIKTVFGLVLISHLEYSPFTQETIQGIASALMDDNELLVS